MKFSLFSLSDYFILILSAEVEGIQSESDSGHPKNPNECTNETANSENVILMIFLLILFGARK